MKRAETGVKLNTPRSVARHTPRFCSDGVLRATPPGVDHAVSHSTPAMVMLMFIMLPVVQYLHNHGTWGKHGVHGHGCKGKGTESRLALIRSRYTGSGFLIKCVVQMS